MADWSHAFSLAIDGIISLPLSDIRSVTDAIAKALDGVLSWDLAKALEGLKDAVVGALSGVLTVAGIASLIEILTNIRDAVKTLTSDVTGNQETETDDSSDSGLLSFFKLMYLLLAIIILLIVIFINCLHFIISIFSIPSSTVLLNEHVLMGITFVKQLQLGQFNLSLYDLIMLLVHFLLFIAIITSLRRKIEKFRF